MSDTYPDLLTLKEVAEILKISVETSRRLAKRKDNPLPTVHVTSRTPRVLKRDLLLWLKSQPDPREDI